MLFKLATLGCKVNQYETEWLREGFRRLGYIEAVACDVADIVVVNTCTVTAESDLKSRKIVRKLSRENPGAQVVVMGCSATRDPSAWADIAHDTKIIVDKHKLPEFLAELGLPEPPRGIRRFGERHRAYVKVQDGCRVGCSYCIIPKVRPELRSRPVEEVLEEIVTLSQNGYREIVLTGIHLGHYGVDIDTAHRPTLASLLAAAVTLKLPLRYRISSLEAVEVSDELVDLMAEHSDKICPHLHLSMQSGSDEVLQRMRRRWLREPFVKRCEEILSRFDRLALTTDVIVGFPGETEEQFEETCRTVEQLGFSKVHIFRFSPRRGTEAALLPNRIPPPIQRRRAERLAALAQRLRENYAASLAGMRLPVLLETPHGGTADRYVDVRLTKNITESSVGQIVSVQIDQVVGDVLMGTVS